MGRIVLVTGGCRSGKSRFARERAEATPGTRTYVATCPRVDGEMTRRIARHQAERAARSWATIEEPRELAQALRTAPAGVVLVDCITLWLSNLLCADETHFGEDEAAAAATEVIAAARAYDGAVFLVTNEVGLGIVPENALARAFRDVAGRANQTFAAAADEVVFMVSGLPLVVKPASAQP